MTPTWDPCPQAVLAVLEALEVPAALVVLEVLAALAVLEVLAALVVLVAPVLACLQCRIWVLLMMRWRSISPAAP